jgi:hypothetical protein
MTEIAYGKTEIGQKVYDFGMSKVSDRWLARKYGMPIVEVRALRKRMREAITPKRHSKRNEGKR